jgi:hypothetical protein
MPNKTEQQKIFNDALAAVTRTKRELRAIYTAAQEGIEKELAVFKIKIEKGLLSEAQALRRQRLLKLYADIDEEIKNLYAARGDAIINQVVAVEIGSYYKMGFTTEKEVNYILRSLPFDYSLGYVQQNPAFIRKTYLDTIIGGQTFKERELVNRAILQRNVRQVVNEAIQDGLTIKDVAKKLGEIDDVFKTDLSRAITTARTEVLRGYSIGQENAIIGAKVAGVEGREIWDATLDSRTRPTHAAKDQTEPGEDGLFHFPDGSAAVGPRMDGLSAKESVNCRCFKIYNVLDVNPVRGGRLPNGDWSTEFGGKTWEDWAAAQEKAGTIDQETKRKLNLVKKLKNT